MTQVPEADTQYFPERLRNLGRDCGTALLMGSVLMRLGFDAYRELEDKLSLEPPAISNIPESDR